MRHRHRGGTSPFRGPSSERTERLFCLELSLAHADGTESTGARRDQDSGLGGHVSRQDAILPGQRELLVEEPEHSGELLLRREGASSGCRYRTWVSVVGQSLTARPQGVVGTSLPGAGQSLPVPEDGTTVHQYPRRLASSRMPSVADVPIRAAPSLLKRRTSSRVRTPPEALTFTPPDTDWTINSTS